MKTQSYTQTGKRTQDLRSYNFDTKSIFKILWGNEKYFKNKKCIGVLLNYLHRVNLSLNLPPDESNFNPKLLRGLTHWHSEEMQMRCQFKLLLLKLTYIIEHQLEVSAFLSRGIQLNSDQRVQNNL